MSITQYSLTTQSSANEIDGNSKNLNTNDDTYMNTLLSDQDLEQPLSGVVVR